MERFVSKRVMRITRNRGHFGFETKEWSLPHDIFHSRVINSYGPWLKTNSYLAQFLGHAFVVNGSSQFLKTRDVSLYDRAIIAGSSQSFQRYLRSRILPKREIANYVSLDYYAFIPRDSYNTEMNDRMEHSRYMYILRSSPISLDLVRNFVDSESTSYACFARNWDKFIYYLFIMIIIIYFYLLSLLLYI